MRMETLLRLLMDKQLENDGFTLVETMLTLFVVSILLFITIVHIPKFENNHSLDEVQNIKYFLEKKQFDAMRKESLVLMRIDYQTNEITSLDTKDNSREVLKINHCVLKEGSLTQFTFNNKGDSSAFGTIYLFCQNKTSKLIFQIQKGRFRIE